MERPTSQNHLEAFSADTTDIPSPQRHRNSAAEATLYLLRVLIFVQQPKQ